MKLWLDRCGKKYKFECDDFNACWPNHCNIFKENPEETQKELLDNREVFVATHKKYFDKVIVVVRTEENGTIINTCRMVESEALSVYEKLKTIETWMKQQTWMRQQAQQGRNKIKPFSLSGFRAILSA